MKGNTDPQKKPVDYSAMISVIVPVYNAEDFLRRCIDSVLEQSFVDFELILVDDGSTDASGDICDDYENKYSCVRVIHKNNGGQASARNCAVKIARGKFICFVDADDAMHPQMLEKLHSLVRNSSDCISVCGTKEGRKADPFLCEERIDYKTEFLSIGEDTFMRLFNEPYICWTVWGKLIPATIVKDFPFTDGRVYEDNAVVLKWLNAAKSIRYIHEPLYFYQNNPNGTTKSNWSEKKTLDGFWARSEQLLFFIDNKMYRLFNRFYSGFMLDLTHEYYNNESKRPIFAKRIRSLAIKWWKKRYLDDRLDSTQTRYICGMIHPFIERVYEWIKNRISSLFS